jgi:hypothetical protein
MEFNIPVKRIGWLDRKNGVRKTDNRITAITILSGNTHKGHPPFPRPPAFATLFAEASKVRKASTGRPVRPKRCFNDCPPKANS